MARLWKARSEPISMPGPGCEQLKHAPQQSKVVCTCTKSPGHFGFAWPQQSEAAEDRVPECFASGQEL